MHAVAALIAVLVALIAVCSAAPVTSTTTTAVNVTATDYTPTAVTYFNTFRTVAKVPAMRANAALTTACRRHAIDMATNKFLGERGSDGSTTVSRANDAKYKWSKLGLTMGTGYTTADAYLKTMNKDNNPWIVDKAIVDIGAVYARIAPNGQIYYDVCYGAPAL
ncbi:hypothetical protein AMAG_15610 [Allomyces macrogynus ATCC 38327]|uniref:SCP domain-containing protein n=1 Tax=Allomyces macrogynus (strain ATCC 38327) TaxID=578462 RepID=A0A0L0T9I3_ALLM3|nr:hypothetical protein AMAG_15610 [Allomyces macrogynus ATCC 38327]|eukprot:KNE71375.1 hypothetical protein AMAG_15610 [Allomyces macrogynus ATCC 38327]